MKIQYSMIAIILGAGLATLGILSSDQIFQNALAQMDSVTGPEATPSGTNMTDGNMTDGNMTGMEEGIPTANTTGDPTQVPVGSPVPLM